MRTEDPWLGIERSVVKSKINARRISNVGSAAWGLYWGVDANRHCLLILQRSAGEYRSTRLPKLRGLAIDASKTENGQGERIIVRLTDDEQREIFHRFCIDVVDATRIAKSPDEAVERFLMRTWRWHRLLKSGRDGRLSDEEQKGLIGELRLIERFFLEMIGAQNTVEGWVGPLGSTKDFQFGLVGVEVKTRSPQRPEVRISSIHQLEMGVDARLFLSVAEIASALGDLRMSVTVTDIAVRVKKAIVKLDISAVASFEERLSAVGFDWQDDYTDKPWTIGDEVLYEVTEAFPRITSSMISSAVSDVQYLINLTECESHRVSSNIMEEAILGEDNDA